MTCRICFDTKSERHVSFDSASADSVSWTYVMEFCVGIKVAPESNAPKMLCRNCAVKLREFFIFKTKCLESDAYWTQITLNKDGDEDTADCLAECPNDDENHRPDATHTKIQSMLKPNITDYDFDSDESSKNAFEVISDNYKTKIEIDGDCWQDLSNENIFKNEVKTEDLSDVDDFETDTRPATEPFKTGTPAPLIRKPRSSHKQIKESSTQPTTYTKVPVKREKLNSTKIESAEKINNKGRTIKQEVVSSYLAAIGEKHKTYKKNSSDKPKKVGPVRTKSEKHVKTENEPIIIYKLLGSQSYSNYHSSGDFNLNHKRKIASDAEKLEALELYCGICSYQCTELSDLKYHWEKHITKNDLKCQLCEYGGRDFADMAAHRHKHFPPEFAHKTQCLLCSKTFRYGFVYRLLECHYRETHLKKIGAWCNVCGKEYLTFNALQKHEINHTKSLRRYVCDYCGISYSRKNTLQVHIIQNHIKKHVKKRVRKPVKKRRRDPSQGTVRTVKCTHCDETFVTYYRLMIHMKIVKGRSLVCETCGATFYCKSYLRKHMNTHSNENSFDCGVCGKKFQWKSNLRSHVQRHAGIKSHKCLQCGKTFQTKYELKKHDDGVHRGTKSVKCTFENCDKAFFTKSKMTRHRAIHFK